MKDTIATLGSTAAVLVLLVGLIWFAWLQRQYRALAAINALVALGTILAFSRHVLAAIQYNETPALLFLAFEVSVLIAFALMANNIRVPAAVVILQAVINLLLMLLLAAFVLTVEFNGLF